MRFKIIFILSLLLFSIKVYAQIDTMAIDRQRLAFEEKLSIKMLTPLDSIRSTEFELEKETAKSKNFFRKIYQYFQQANVDKAYRKKIDFSIIGGPHYSSATGFSVGLMSAGVYKTDLTDPLLQPSVMSIYGDISTTGFYLLGLRGYHLFPKRKHRVDYSAYLFSFPSEFWGAGYENGMGMNPDLQGGQYKRKNYQLKVDYMYNVIKGLNVGANISFEYVEGIDWDENALALLATFDNPQHSFYTSGVGVFLMYDTRNVITNPSKGIYTKLTYSHYPELLGNSPTAVFSSTELEFRAYHSLWKGAILAYDFHAVLNTGDTPWTSYFNMGGTTRMRGYYEGRFRDNNGIEAQIEYRQKVWKRIGVTGWIGAGNVFSSLDTFKWEETLPNWGVGLRWEFKKDINLRLDYGWGAIDANGNRISSIIFNINEAF